MVNSDFMNTSAISYCKTLAHIRARKEELRNGIQKDKTEIQKQWDTLFHQPEETLLPSPTQKVMKMMNTSAGIFDGLLLGWKLYRKYGKKVRKR